MKKLFISSLRRLINSIKHGKIDSKNQTIPGFSFFLENSKIDNYKFSHTRLLDAAKANQFLKTQILAGKPFMASRFGNIDLWLCCNHLFNAFTNEKEFSESLATKMFELDAIWPNETKYLESFCDQFFISMKNIDYLGYWENRGEEILSKFFFREAAIGPLISYESYFFQDPWTFALENKKVLVIHPYTESITSQYNNKKMIFNNPNVLPDFKLITYKPFNIITDDIKKYKSWHHALEIMQEDIKKIQFDIALVGAGHFGLPLASFIKQNERQAIHVGGALQLLFGIKGKRWENREQAKFFNENWVYPSENETPDFSKRMKVDGGDYWK